MHKKLKNRRGLTYVEVIFALPIALFSIFAAMAAIMSALTFNENARAYTQAMNLGLYRLEEVRNYATLDAESFRAKMLDDHNQRFPTYEVDVQSELDAIRSLGLDPARTEAVTRVSMLSTYDLADVTVVICYKDKNGRAVGEDRNFNGVLDSGEDGNGNELLDSPIMFHVLVARK